MLEAFQSSAESEPYMAIFSPLEHPQQEVRQPALLPPSESDSTANPHSPISTAGKPAVAPAVHEPTVAPVKRKRRARAPNGDDHLIYRMAKLDGSGQDFTAQCFGIHQSTVSRIVRRYERWEAHASAREEGRLDPAERLRSQCWLAFERNEAMLTSCLRLAGEVERCKELSKSVTHYPQRYPTAETEVRNESWVLGRVGMAARFLRLAFRINMEQVKLAGAEPPPLPEPLTEEEVAEQEAQAAEERAEIAAVRERSNQHIEEEQRSIMDHLQAAQYEAAQARAAAAAARDEAEQARREAEAARRDAEEARQRAEAALAQGAGDREQETGDRERAEVTLHNLPNLHTAGDENSSASADLCGTCAMIGQTKENAWDVHESHAPAPTGASGTCPTRSSA